MVAELAAQEMLVILEVPVTLAAKVPVVREALQLVAQYPGELGVLVAQAQAMVIPGQLVMLVQAQQVEVQAIPVTLAQMV